MIRVALFASGDLSNRKGIMNYVHEKALRFALADAVTCDVFIIRSENSWLFSKLANENYHKHFRACKSEIDGVVYHNLWHTYTLLENIVYTKLLKLPQSFLFSKKVQKTLRQYDIIATHDVSCHYIAEAIKRKYHIPFVATWHGSDINIAPSRGKHYVDLVGRIIKNADCNLFVSKALLKKSDEIITDGFKDVIYTGPSGRFTRYNDGERTALRNKYGVGEKKVVAYVGNLFSIKNVLCLPDIFREVSNTYKGKIIYWIIGDGVLESTLKNKLQNLNVDCSFLGKKTPDEMPDYMNVIDVLVLPSLNEGLPLVTLEALKCGAKVVGSNVGGIPESIGLDNVFPLDNDFVSNISKRIVELLKDSNQVFYPNSFSWERAVQKEIDIYLKILNHGGKKE